MRVSTAAARDDGEAVVARGAQELDESAHLLVLAHGLDRAAHDVPRLEPLARGRRLVGLGLGLG